MKVEGNGGKPGMVLAYHEVMPESELRLLRNLREPFLGQLALVSSLVEPQGGRTAAATITFDDGERLTISQRPSASLPSRESQGYVFCESPALWARKQSFWTGKSFNIAGCGTFDPVTRLLAQILNCLFGQGISLRTWRRQGATRGQAGRPGGRNLRSRRALGPGVFSACALRATSEFMFPNLA